ncbi:MAG: hypothetical protein WHS46_14600 [Desulfosoma sp.]
MMEFYACELTKKKGCEEGCLAEIQQGIQQGVRRGTLQEGTRALILETLRARFEDVSATVSRPLEN